MNLWHCLTTALSNLRANKLRSLLTMLGIIIGVSAVIMMVSILQGMEQRVRQEFEKLGSNLILVLYEPSKAELKKTTRRIDSMTMDDVRAIEDHCNLVRAISVEMPLPGSSLAKYAGRDMDVSPNGVQPDYAQLRNVRVARGRFITDSDISVWAKVCVVGSKVQSDLFRGADPIGHHIDVNGEDFLVVGVAVPKGRTFNGDADTMIFIPLSTVQKRMLGSDRVGTIFAEPVDLAHMNAAKDQIWQLLMHRYQNLIGFRVDSLDNMLNSIQQVILIFTIVLGSIAGLALLVGGIGIMNIMLVSVTERTREIGIRKAIGAKRRDILVQFLIESATISGVGGLSGVAIGTAMAYLTHFITTFIPAMTNAQTGEKGMAVYVPLSFSMAAFLFSAGIGIFFGVYPAVRAASLDPIEALRHE